MYNAQHGPAQSSAPVLAHGMSVSVGVAQSQEQAQLESPCQALVQTHRGLVHVRAPNIRNSEERRQAVMVAELRSRTPSARRQQPTTAPRRGRSRERTVDSPQLFPPGTYRMAPAGPMETMDWLQALEGINC